MSLHPVLAPTSLPSDSHCPGMGYLFIHNQRGASFTRFTYIWRKLYSVGTLESPSNQWFRSSGLMVTSVQFSRSVVSNSFVTSWTAARQASLFITNSWSLLKLMSIESVMPSNHLILCHPLLLPSIFSSIRVFSNESALRIGGQSIGASVLPMNTQY